MFFLHPEDANALLSTVTGKTCQDGGGGGTAEVSVRGLLRLFLRKAVSEKPKCEQFTTRFLAVKRGNHSQGEEVLGKIGHYILL